MKMRGINKSDRATSRAVPGSAPPPLRAGLARKKEMSSIFRTLVLGSAAARH